MTGWDQFRSDTRAASAVEFALILPLALLFLLGIIDVGRYMWQVNQLEKAAQMGVRLAVVTNLVEKGLQNETYVGSTACGTALAAGDPICREALGVVTCSSTSCEPCTVAPCPASDYDGDAYVNIRNRAKVFAPILEDANIRVIYSGSGLGFAGDPSTVSIAPIVTVRLQGVDFHSISLLGTSFNLPTISRSQTLEDGIGTHSN